MESTTEPVETTFKSMGLIAPLLKSLEALGYEAPTAIQALAIPLLLEGRDLIGQAQTGTGKTAAFALPLLGRVDISENKPQLLVLAPTRELALQVCEAMQTYARHLDKLYVLPVYGGQGMATQLRALRRGVHVVVGTPGRLLDHLERGTLKLEAVKALVLDEADEMLRMGFIEEVEKILESVPESRQTALFSATMPPRIAQIAKRFLQDPAEVRTKSKETTVESVSQHYVLVSGDRNKLEAMTRILEVEDFDGMIVFVRTRIATAELAEKLEARGYGAVALNGDMNQQQRQRNIERFKAGGFDILVCTDVAARGLDVPRISHVLNYDIPSDTESYVHRIGRTGRAGREGKAILFAGRREWRMLQTIERATGRKIERVSLPTGRQVGQRRIDEFKALLGRTIDQRELDFFKAVVSSYSEESEHDMETIAGALAYFFQRERPFTIQEVQIEDREPVRSRERNKGRRQRGPEGPDRKGPRRRSVKAAPPDDKAVAETRSKAPREKAPDGKRTRGGESDRFARSMEVFRVEVGKAHGLEPRHLVGAIANEAGLSGRHIGSIRVSEDHATVQLPAGMPAHLLSQLKKVWVCGAQLDMKPLHSPDGKVRRAKLKDSKSGGGQEGRGAARAKPRFKAKHKKKKPKS